MKIALIHDWLTRLGGAERVLIALHKIFPEAPIYTLFHDQKFTSEYLPRAKIIPSFLQKIPNIKKLHPWFKILMPSAVESLDLSGFDLIISSSHEFSHGVLVKQKTSHICFYHSPSRIIWDRAHEYLSDFKERGRGRFKLSLIKLGQHFLRLWDYTSSQRPDIILANSRHVAERIKKYYGREAKVVYPPISFPMDSLGLRNRESSIFQPNQIDLGKIGTPYFLIVSQLYPHKNIDLAIEAFKNLPNLNLLTIGDGPKKKNLESRIKNYGNVKLLGFVPDSELPYYYQNCLAYLICNEEDFGLSPVEAMSFGKPVLALRQGGAVETVLEGITGEFFEKTEPDNLAKAAKSMIENVKDNRYDSGVIKKHSEKFGFERFKKEILDLVKSLDYNKKT